MNVPKITLHTHTTYCDGADTPEEMVRAALEAGVETLGFSGHSFTPFDPSWCMSEEGTVRYREEILRLRKVYGGRINILLGIERDFFSAPDPYPYDYVIGSIHYILADDGAVCPVDESPKDTETAIREHFGGDACAWVRRYYETVARVKERTGCDVVGHFDLVEKFNAGNRFFDPETPACRMAAHTALRRLLDADAIFEINTGAMVNGYRNTPYPAPDLLRVIAGAGGRVLLSADAHDSAHLLSGFSEAAHYAAACGVSRLTVPRDGKWIEF